MTTPQVTLEPVRPEDMDAYRRRLQDSFTTAALEAFPDFPEVIPPERDIDESLAAPGAEALQILCDGEPVGGAIVSGDGASKLLDFLFIDTACQNRHLGHAAWLAIEARYPDAERIDAHGGVIMPGLINAHTHIYSGLARGLSIRGNNPTNFLEVLEGTWWNIDRHLTLDMTRAMFGGHALQ